MDLVTFIENNWFAIGGLIAICGFVWKSSNTIHDFKDSIEKRDKELDEKLDNMKSEINTKIDNLDERITEQENKRADSTERTRLIMEGVEATLHTLHNQGANGPVTKSLQQIEEYKNRKAVE